MAQAQRISPQHDYPAAPKIIRLPTGMRFPKDIWDDLPHEERQAFLRMAPNEIEERWQSC